MRLTSKRLRAEHLFTPFTWSLLACCMIQSKPPVSKFNKNRFEYVAEVYIVS